MTRTGTRPRVHQPLHPLLRRSFKRDELFCFEVSGLQVRNSVLTFLEVLLRFLGRRYVLTDCTECHLNSKQSSHCHHPLTNPQPVSPERHTRQLLWSAMEIGKKEKLQTILISFCLLQEPAGTRKEKIVFL